jgi:hypothetical protein
MRSEVTAVKTRRGAATGWAAGVARLRIWVCMAVLVGVWGAAMSGSASAATPPLAHGCSMQNWLANGQTQTCQWVDNCQNNGNCGCTTGGSAGTCYYDWSVSGSFYGGYKSATASLRAYDETNGQVYGPIDFPKCSVQGPYTDTTNSCSATTHNNPAPTRDTLLYTCSMEANSITGLNNELMVGEVSCSDSMDAWQA